MKKITFLIACLLAVFGMSAINHYDNLYVVGDVLVQQVGALRMLLK